MNSRMAFFAGPSFHEGNGSVCSCWLNAGPTRSTAVNTASTAPQRHCRFNMVISPYIALDRGQTLITSGRLQQLLQHPVKVEGARLLTRRKLLVGCDVFRHQRLGRHHQKDVVNEPPVVGARLVVGPLEWVAAKRE